MHPTPDEPQINGPAVRALRVAAGVPAARMADDLGLSRSYLSMIEHGHRRNCRVEIIRAIARYLLVSPAAICTFADDAA